MPQYWSRPRKGPRETVRSGNVNEVAVVRFQQRM